MPPNPQDLLPTREADTPAGSFSTWLESMAAVLTQGAEATVPCGSCNACCRSGYFVHVHASDAAALARIPAELLFPAPGRSDGSQVMGYDEAGRCPMLTDGACAIYEDRPQTCRAYDCRVFAAAGVHPGEGRDAVADQAARWRFAADTPEEKRARDAVREAAAFIAEHPECRPEGTGDGRTQLALLALRAHEAFLSERPSERDEAALVAALRALWEAP